jgi:hypothetical protein
VKRLLALAIALVALTACGSFGLRSHPISLAFESGDSYSYKLPWIDTSGHRIVKTHSSGNTDGTLAVSMASPTSTPAAFQGPFSFKGTQSVEIDPA